MVGICTALAATLGAQSVPKAPTTPPSIAGVPQLPDVVAVVPFYWKENETDLEKTKVIIPAEVDGIRGNFILDTGDYDVDLNRTYLQPNSKGGVDSITATNSIPEHGWDTVRVKLRLGTVMADLSTSRYAASDPHKGKVVLDHVFGNFSWVFAPRLGNIGIPALEPFETVIDYTHQRVIFIRLDSAGHRLAQVPAYTPRGAVPLIKTQNQVHWALEAQMDGAIDTLIVDTGNPGNPSEKTAADQLKHAVATGQKFQVDKHYTMGSKLGLGYEFLRPLGVVGFGSVGKFVCGAILQGTYGQTETWDAA